ncbi:MAG: hypothetical protein Q7W51_01765 [Coriobacteriia bacterium]|nr:hypothetical protein [Coriobacteriia bacterium]
MRTTARLTALPLAAAAWLAGVTPAWANAVDPELYPEAAAEYERMMTTTFGIIFGCFGLAVVGFIAFVVLLIVWLVRRDRRKQAEALAAAGIEPAPAAQPQAPAAGAAETPPTDGL